MTGRERKQRLLRVVLAGLIVTLCLGRGPLRAEPDVEKEVSFEEITPEVQESIERGLAKLAQMQLPDGSWTYSGQGGDVGITALAGIAFLAGGNLPGRGAYGDNVEKATEYILAHVRRDGYISSGNSQMYQHGFATLFLAEVYGMSPSDEVKAKLKMAVRLIESCQNSEGGWRYNPQPVDADISVTICQIMALRAARNAGIKVDKRVIDRGILYVKACQLADGGFAYQAGSQGSGYARTAAGVCSLYYAGAYGDNAITRGLQYLHTHNGFTGEASYHFHYGHYYAAQAMFQAGGDYWKKYYTTIRENLVKSQRADGSWTGPTSGAYPTAMACIVLEIPYRYLPILQR